MTTSRSDLKVETIRRDFPILRTTHGGKPLVYFDNAATAQKPTAVLERIDRFYREENANIHRGLYRLSETATRAYEDARAKVARFIGARSSEEIVFVRGATEAINLVAATFGRTHVGKGDFILLTAMEHHANIVPWQLLAEAVGASIEVVPVTDEGVLDLEAMESLLARGPALAAFVHISNALGTINPVARMVAMARRAGVPTLVDGAQAVSHHPVNVAELDCDFYVFSGHKLFGPTGIGVLYGRSSILKEMPPYQGGGDMIEKVSFSGTTFARPPARFEAGTPAIAPAVGLGAAIDYLQGLDWEAVEAHEARLGAALLEAVRSIPALRLVGEAKDRIATASFHIEGVHPHDLATFLDRDGIAVRAGHHCTQPLMERFGLTATTRASLAFYNTFEEIERFATSLRRTVTLLA